MEKEVLHKNLSYKLNAILFEVQNRLGTTSNEKQCADMLALLLAANGMRFEREKEIPFIYPEGIVRGNRVDFLIEDVIPLDVKAKKYITKEDYFQMKRYLKATKNKLGIIVNFKQFPLEIRRVLDPNGLK